MLNKLVLLSVVLLSNLALADVSSVILQDGSVARCSETGDSGGRAFRLKILSADDSKIILKLDTLICVNEDKKALLVAAPLAEKIVFTNDKDMMSYEINSASIQVTNIDGTVELLKVDINPKLASQEVELNIAGIAHKSIDLTILGLEEIKLNNKPYDQGMIFGGNYRITKK